MQIFQEGNDSPRTAVLELHCIHRQYLWKAVPAPGAAFPRNLVMEGDALYSFNIRVRLVDFGKTESVLIAFLNV